MHYARVNNLAAQKLCHTGVKNMSLSTDDVLFNTGEAAYTMFFILSGKLEYLKAGKSTILFAGMWVGEPLLWTPWEYRGKLRCTTESKVVALDVRVFLDIVRDNHVAGPEAGGYAMKAVEKMREVSLEDLSDLDGAAFDSWAIAKEVFEEAGEAWGSKGQQAYTPKVMFFLDAIPSIAKPVLQHGSTQPLKRSDDRSSGSTGRNSGSSSVGSSSGRTLGQTSGPMMMAVRSIKSIKSIKSITSAFRR
eukprot:gnl/TRDRNA2_/TRDRNA2_154385_c5_seq1.p1 gnl/TRDRNA2_/TRDRNA2_154385_c5~~gnl/TRDRNA2_/TRDRNA2_154385_c5_seq1.p1  ORF type:complete len:247 (+),score=43.89 gnl/TRDRNA2_/TRDRNA2_154385_c5_seq1:3-743(+)